MSNAHRTFIELALNGEILPSEIDDFVDAWHESTETSELNEYLGLTGEEYSFWVSNPDAIDLIVAARHRRQSLIQAVNDNVNSFERLAARSGNPEDIKRLKRWIEQQSDYRASN